MGTGIINVAIVTIVFVATILVIRNYIARGGKGDCCGGADVVRSRGPRDKDASHYPFAYDVVVEGMSCENCAKRIANAFNSRPDTMAKVSLAEGVAHVWTKQAANQDDLRRVVRSEGYGVGAVSER